MTPRLRALSPAVMEKAVSVWKQELTNGLTPEGALVIVLSEVMPLHAHELAEKQRAFDGPSITMAGNRMVPLNLITAVIDPEVSSNG